MNRTLLISSLAGLSLFVAAFLFGTPNSAGQQPNSIQPTAASVGKYVDKDGTIHLPEDYRLKWTHLGSWYIEDAANAPGGMHDGEHRTKLHCNAELLATLLFPPGQLHPSFTTAVLWLHSV